MRETSGRPGEPDSEEAAPLLADWVAELAARIKRGESIDLEAYGRQCPDRAEDLQRLLPTIRLMAAMRAPGHLGTESTEAGRDGWGPAVEPKRLGDFEIVREIGRGGMGVVYEARQLTLGRRVALKVLPSGVALDPRHVARFQLEAHVAGGLNHPHIVPVYAVGSEQGTYYYAMPLIDGQSLAEVIRTQRSNEGLDRADPAEERTRTLATEYSAARPGAQVVDRTEKDVDPEAAAARKRTAPNRPDSSGPRNRDFILTVAGLGLHAAEALAYAHDQGVIHRDIKPSNLIVDDRGDVWITDFGLARLLGNETLTGPGDLLGTLRYMSPEQAMSRREVVDHRTDIYSLGVTLYELLTLRPAIVGEDRQELLRRIVGEEPRPPRRLNRAIPKDLETIVLKAMAKDPADRYTSAAALSEDLRRFLGDRPISARRPSPLEHAARWSRRHRSWVCAGIAVLFAVAVVATVEAVRINGARKEAIRLAARHALDNAISSCERGEVGRGMLGLAQALPLAEAAGDPNLERVIRANLAAWRTRLTELVAVLPHESADVRCVAMSRDGRRALTGCTSGMARLWDAQTGAPIGPPVRHGAMIAAVAFAPDSCTAAICSVDGFVWLLEADTGRMRQAPLKIPFGGVVLAFSPDGRSLLTGGPAGSVQLRRLDGGRPVGKPMRHKGRITIAAFSPDGQRIATGGVDNTARLWDAGTQAPLGEPMVHGDVLTDLAFGPEGKVLLTGSRDRTARLWDGATGRPVGRPMVHAAGVLAVALSPDGRFVATGGGENSARLWDLRQSTPDSRALRHGSWVHDLTFSPDGQTLLTASGDNQGRLWDVKTASPVSPPLVHSGTVESVAIGPDGGSMLTAGRDYCARLWRAPPPPEASTRMASDVNFYRLALSPGLDSLLSCDLDNVVRIWDVATGKAVGPPLSGAGRTALRFSQDGTTAVTAGERETVLWRDVRHRPVSVRVPFHSTILEVAFRPDGAVIAAGCRDGKIRLWETSTLQSLGEVQAHAGPIMAIVFSPDGHRLISGGMDNSPQVWNATTLARLGPALTHEGTVRAVAFGRSGRYAVIGGTDMTVQVWDISAGRPVGAPLRQTGAVAAAVFSPDERLVLTACADGTARFWDVATSRPIGPALVHGDAVHAVAFTLDGRSALTASLDRTVRRWPVPQSVAGDSRGVLTATQRMTGVEGDSSGVTRAVRAAMSGDHGVPLGY